MRIFFQEEKKLLIVTPYLCGSTYLAVKCNKFSLTSLVPQRGNKLLHEILNTEEITKQFIYRDPIERYFSFYSKFIFQPKDDIDNSDLKNFIPKKRQKNFWDDMYESLSNLKDIYMDDRHTWPQYSFFQEFSQNEGQYEIYSLDEYSKWLYLTFGVKETIPEHSYEKYEVTNFFKALKIYDKLKTLYKIDYDKLQSLVIPL